jgi:uncharacterized membrane protein
MESRAKFAGHPIHQMMVAFPIGAFGLAATSDVLRAGRSDRSYEHTAARAIDFGLVSAALAVPFGLVDWLAIPRGTRARRVGAWHGLGNAALLGLFVGSRWLRARGDIRRAQWLSTAGMLLGGMTAWLGGELVDRHGIGVHAQLSLDEPGALPRNV